MKGRQRSSSRLGSRAGFTVIEMLVYLVLALLVIGSIYQVLIGQNRLYSKEREVMDVRNTLRSAAEAMAVGLRMSSTGDGDIYQIKSDSIVMRELMGSGVVCGTALSGRALGLYWTSGTFAAEVNDSILVYTGSGNSGWVATKAQLATDGYVAALPTCSWSATQPEWVVAVDTVDGSLLDGTRVGSEVRAFRKSAYYIGQYSGRWWLMRGQGTFADFDVLAGPLQSPADGGLVFKYYDANGDTTSVISDIALIAVSLRGESLHGVKRVRSNPTPQVDSLTIYVATRG